VAWLFPFAAQLAVLFALRPAIEPVLSVASSREAPFGRYVALFRLIEETSLRAPRLAALREVLTSAGATRAIGRLERIIGFAELRHSGLVAVFANLFLLWDAFVAASLLRWRAQHGREVRRWIEAMAEIEALASLGTFAAEHPDYAFPTVDAGEKRFVAEGLGHPLLPGARRVTNDVSIPRAGSALMITGSNMSGKSTLLRAIGVNAVLALAGAPVCAKRLVMAECVVRSSMRIKDSLDEGVSHFYAEIARLKAVVDAVDAGERVLFLLDEVLHGTNSRERNIGAKAVITHLVDEGAIGGVSSHDLGLADLERETGGRVVNVHFQELVGDGKMVFDYKLKPGVVTSSNALRLMKLVGIGVALPED
jgi:DNA mismatch repair ATPase MutS